MDALPFAVTHELPGWSLFWALLELRSSVESEELDAQRVACAKRVRGRYALENLAAEPAVAELRKLFRAAGTDPTRYRPSSEALLRRLLKGGELPAIHPLVDLNNCLSAELPAPCCVMDAQTLEPPFIFRAGVVGEGYESFRGPFKLEGRPVLCDARGPCDAPITGNARVKVSDSTERAWLVAYLPAAVLKPALAEDALKRLVVGVHAAEILATGSTGGEAARPG